MTTVPTQERRIAGERKRLRIDVTMVGIDGTWYRHCQMEDVSNDGAKLTVPGSISGLDLNEFFLLLSRVGNAHRRCQLRWVNGGQIGVKFVKTVATKKSVEKPAAVVVDKPVLARRSEIAR